MHRRDRIVTQREPIALFANISVSSFQLMIGNAKNSACTHCGSENIIRGVRARGKGNPNSEPGLAYQVRTMGIAFTQTEPFFADLCQQCGTVVRLYVLTTDVEWVQHGK